MAHLQHVHDSAKFFWQDLWKIFSSWNSFRRGYYFIINDIYKAQT